MRETATPGCPTTVVNHDKADTGVGYSMTRRRATNGSFSHFLPSLKASWTHRRRSRKRKQEHLAQLEASVQQLTQERNKVMRELDQVRGTLGPGIASWLERSLRWSGTGFLVARA